MKKYKTSDVDRRKLLRTTGTAISSSLMLGATGAVSAQQDQQVGQEGDDNGRNRTNECEYSRQFIETKDGSTAALIEVSGQKFLFRENNQSYYQPNSLGAGPTFQTTRTGDSVGFQEVDPSITASDISSTGEIKTQQNTRSGSGITTQQVDFTPENFIEDYDAELKQIDDSCGDIAFSNHNAIELHLDGGGAFSSLGVAGLAGVVCYAAGAAGSIPTAGLSGAAAAGGCSILTAAIDQLIDVEMIPNETELTVAYWDVDEEGWWGVNTSPTMRVGLKGDYYADWDEMSVSVDMDNLKSSTIGGIPQPGLHIPG